MTATRKLPKPDSDFWRRQLKAACKDLRTNRFFHPENEAARSAPNGSAGPRRCAGAVRSCRNAGSTR
ncbi:hypothetical protein GCM10009854_41490 [Saccharopolyspora halophila]|uniref:Uncharacterized protein n=1 Tax=Saccharopolyspora halophila TaxID=405551 RepID=A0ABN3GQT8_9PSEU